MTRSSTLLPRLLGLLAVVVAAAAIVPAAASAKTVRYETSLSMQAQPSGNGVGQAFLFGNAVSEKAACENRTVNLYRQVPGDPNTWDYTWDAIEVTADEDGGFLRYLSKADEAYDYTAVVGKTVIRKPNKKIVCEGAWMYDVVIPR